jgi:hypothetical protein
MVGQFASAMEFFALNFHDNSSNFAFQSPDGFGRCGASRFPLVYVISVGVPFAIASCLKLPAVWSRSWRH